MTLAIEAEENFLQTFFLPLLKDGPAFDLLKKDLEHIAERCIDGVLHSKGSLRKDLTVLSQNTTQTVMNHCARLMQWSDSSEEAAALRNAYFDMVMLGISAKEASEKRGADIHDLNWLVERRPPEKVDKEQLKPSVPVTIKKGSKR